MVIIHSPSCLDEFLDESYTMFDICHALVLQRLVLHLGFGHTFVSLTKSSKGLVIVLVLINLHLKQRAMCNTEARVFARIFKMPVQKSNSKKFLGQKGCP